MAGKPVRPADGGADAVRPGAAEQRRLAALAAEGRERQAAALVAEEAEERRIRREERRELERLLRPNIRLSLLDSPRGKAPPLTAIACGLVVLGTVLLMFTDESAEQRGWASVVGLALVLGASTLFFPARWILGMRLERVERKWLQSLPFPVKGYFRVLSATPSEETRVRVLIHFRGEPPEREVLDGLLGRVQFPASARLTDGRGATRTAESGPIRTVFVEDGTPSNAAPLHWMRGVIDEALLPLHEAYPLREVEFRG
jgi:hypothetical protein